MVEDMGREQMRAADADRQQVADQLRAALEEGRLDLAEFDERLRDAYAAKTYGDLDRLLTDLPNAAPVVPAPPQAASLEAIGQRDGLTRAWLGHVWGPWSKALAFFTLIWALGWIFSSEPVVFYWPVWILGPWGVVLLVRTVGGLGSGEPRKHALEAEHRRRLREHRYERKMLYRQAIATGELPMNPSKQQRKAFIAEAVARGDLAPKPRKPADEG
ncbi:DUF1707 SHOCT-like domain-containing protein [Actinoplanes sp. CA-142083]|uniref:DUF1707 SHOCT-like domain-containing protein n=1 Tax=Actinoplanes sp. CA-142083 TaxID=3239903 RepID=UPI003D93ECA1